jgi:hypothetical protein
MLRLFFYLLGPTLVLYILFEPTIDKDSHSICYCSKCLSKKQTHSIYINKNPKIPKEIKQAFSWFPYANFFQIAYRVYPPPMAKILEFDSMTTKSVISLQMDKANHPCEHQWDFEYDYPFPERYKVHNTFWWIPSNPLSKNNEFLENHVSKYCNFKNIQDCNVGKIWQNREALPANYRLKQKLAEFKTSEIN